MTTTASTIESIQAGPEVFPRLQLALNVPNLDEAIAFYNSLFDATPHKVREGYANYALVNPPLKLILFENANASERLNHLGVEVESPADVIAHTRRVAAQMPVRIEEGTVCCHALQDKFWVDGPGRTPWEYYTVLDETPEQASDACACDDTPVASACCGETQGAANCC
jgi:catechol 2,3-dioxygenase-like lactoylglutathione lyase family enzyme